MKFKIIVAFMAMIIAPPALCMDFIKCTPTAGSCGGGLGGANGSSGSSVAFTNSRCSLSGTTISFNGLSECALNGTSPTTSLEFSQGDTDKNIYCWCMLTSPLVTQWVKADSYRDDFSCDESCSARCLNAFQQGGSAGLPFFDNPYE